MALEGKELRPIHAQGIFNLTLYGEVTQVLIFDYEDRSLYYARLMDEGDIEAEMESLMENMQGLLDEEEVYINNEITEPTVEDIDIIFRGQLIHPSIIFFIRFSGKLKEGMNIYENRYEATVAEYDYEVYWLMPSGVRILEVQMSGEYEATENTLLIWVKKGDQIEGYEKIVFEIPYKL